MSTSSDSTSPDSQWFGHPRGLSTLFFTEMWERFSYYGMRAILTLFMTAPVAAGGFGWAPSKAGPIYGLYTAMVYMSAMPGGWLADRLIGQRRAVFIGGVIIALGHVSLMFHGESPFYLGLFLVVAGTGLLKPNISAIVGQLYEDGDARRDAGFSMFYMGINLGAGSAPLICGWLAQSPAFKATIEGWGFRPEDSWHWGFGAAAVGMTLGLIQYVLSAKRLGETGMVPAGRGDDATFARNQRICWGAIAVLVVAVSVAFFTGSGAEDAASAEASSATEEPALVRWLGYAILVFPFLYFVYLFRQRGWSDTERRRLYTIPVFFFAAAVFWSAFEQAGSTLTLFADQFTDNRIFGWAFPSSWWQSVNSAFLILLSPVFAVFWLRLGKREPSSPSKFSAGLFITGLGFLVLSWGSLLNGSQTNGASPLWLLTVYLLHTMGELCLSPVGLSTMTKLAPARITGQMMGVWFMASALGNFIGGQIAGLFEKFPLPGLFAAVFLTTLIAAGIVAALVRPVKRWMSGVH